MKKIIILVMAVLMTCTFAVSVIAGGEFATAGDLFVYWEENSYPDYICGVWSNDGGMTNLTFAVQDNEAGATGKQEILDLIADDSTVSFVYQKYSRNYLVQLQNELEPYFYEDVGFIFTGLNEYDNRVDIGILEDRKNDTETQGVIEELTEKYGDAIAIEYTGAIISEGMVETVEIGGIAESNDNNTQKLLLTVCVAVILILASVTVVTLKKKRALTLQTNNGECAVTSPLSVKEVEDMVKSTLTEVSAELDEKIMSEIKE